jgi:hypothetical protein
MTPSQLADFSEILNPGHLSEFLAVQKWACLADKPFGQMWAQPGNLTGSISSVVLPKDPKSPDYQRRLEESIGILTTILGLTTAQLAEKVASIRADLFLVRVDQPMLDGTIPLGQATHLLQGIEKMIRAAATTAANPLHSHRGRLPRGVNEFMEQDVRMGHTKSGSFIVTVVARLDDGDIGAKEREIEVADKPGTPEQVDPTREAPVPFARRVMTTLSRGLDAAHRHASKDSAAFLGLDEAVAAGVSLPLVQALNELGSSETLRSLDLSFNWSVSEPPPVDVPRSIVMDRKEFQVLSDVEERLIRIVEPVTETIMGQVQSLERAEPGEDDGDNGIAVISADVRGQLRRVHVPLSGSDYDWAIVAHHQKLVYSVTGTLRKDGRKWVLSGDVKPDLSFLQHINKSAFPPRSLFQDGERGEVARPTSATELESPE